MKLARLATACLLLALTLFVMVATWSKAEDAWQKRQVRKGNLDCCKPKMECCP